MNLEDQISSYDLSIKMKDLGVKQESLFYWCDKTQTILNYMPENDKATTYTSAFTVAELGEMLPWRLNPESATKRERILVMSKDVLIFGIGYLGDNNIATPQFQSTTEADVRAKMLIHLIENKLMEVPR